MIYVYFNYKSSESQSQVKIAGNLLKQLVAEADIPSDLESLYETSKAKTPESAPLIQLLKSYSKNFSSIYAVFDAFDECGDDNQEDVLDLFDDLEKSGYKLLISSRPQTLDKLQHRLTKTCPLEVHAHISDLKIYVNRRMSKAKITDKILKTELLKLVRRVKGM